ncbi:MAG: glycosyltransferase, partial [Acidimicrobiales bacterium]
MSPPERVVAAVVVNYNAGGHLMACVRSLQGEGCDEIVVVDNASSDGSARRVAAELAGVALIEAGANLGYGRAANRGVAATSASTVVVCNPDLVVHRGALGHMCEALEEDPGLAVVGPRTLRSDGSLYPSARTFPSLRDSVAHGFLGLVSPSNRWTRRYTLADWDHGTSRDVDWVSGACFAARRLAWESLGGFDEAYFMYT